MRTNLSFWEQKLIFSSEEVPCSPCITPHSSPLDVKGTWHMAPSLLKSQIRTYATESKCIISRPRSVASGGNLNHDICFSISGNVIENVESCPHLGHVITNNASDKLDVLSRRGSFIGQVNNVICWFSKLDCCMKTRLY